LAWMSVRIAVRTVLPLYAQATTAGNPAAVVPPWTPSLEDDLPYYRSTRTFWSLVSRRNKVPITSVIAATTIGYQSP
jgi:hypothetical protein